MKDVRRLRVTSFRSLIRWQWHIVVIAWALLIVIGLVVGWQTKSAFIKDVAANFLPDIFVAGLAFVLADVLFGLRKSRAHRVEAQQKAFHLIGMELEENKNELERVVQALQEDRLPSPEPMFETENWRLLMQSPLIERLSVELVWSLQESYYYSRRTAENLAFRRNQTSPHTYDRVAAEFLPHFQLALRLTEEAIETLRQAYVEK